MSKSKKLTYNELANYIVITERKMNHGMNTLGQTITDYIEFKGDNNTFMTFLKKKYKEKKDDMSNVPKGDKT